MSENKSGYFFEQSKSILAPASEDYLFPSLESELNSTPYPKGGADQLIRVITNKSGSAKEILWHTASMGRAGWYFAEFSSNTLNRKFGGIFVASTGTPENVDVSINTELFPPENSMQISKDGEIAGAKTKGDCVLDAQNSIEATKLKVRVRIPLRGFNQKQILLGGSFKPVDKLVQNGLIKDEARPYASLWAMENPFRLGDFTDLIENKDASNLSDIERENIDLFFKQNFLFIRHQKDFNEMFADTSSAQADFIEKSLVFTAKRLGELEKQMRIGKVFHGNMSLQNVSLNGESCDNSHLGFNIDDQSLLRDWEKDKTPRLDAQLAISRFFKAVERLNDVPGISVDKDLVESSFYKAAE